MDQEQLTTTPFLIRVFSILLLAISVLWFLTNFAFWYVGTTPVDIIIPIIGIIIAIGIRMMKLWGLYFYTLVLLLLLINSLYVVLPIWLFEYPLVIITVFGMGMIVLFYLWANKKNFH